MALVQEVKNGQLVDHSATGNSLSKKEEKAAGALDKEDFLKLSSPILIKLKQVSPKKKILFILCQNIPHRFNGKILRMRVNLFRDFFTA